MPSSVAVREGPDPETSAAPPRVKLQFPITIQGLADRGLRCSDRPRQQLAEVERLDQVVVGAGVQPSDPVSRASRAVSISTGVAVPPRRSLRTRSRPDNPGMRQSRTATS